MTFILRIEKKHVREKSSICNECFISSDLLFSYWQGYIVTILLLQSISSALRFSSCQEFEIIQLKDYWNSRLFTVVLSLPDCNASSTGECQFTQNARCWRGYFVTRLRKCAFFLYFYISILLRARFSYCDIIGWYPLKLLSHNKLPYLGRDMAKCFQTGIFSRAD